MRIAVCCVFCLVLNNAMTQPSNSNPTLPIATFNCEDLTSNVHSLKESTRTKKQKFSCIMNLLKSALSDHLDSSLCEAEEIKYDQTNDINSQAIPENKTALENDSNGVKGALFDKLVAKITEAKPKDCPNNTQLLEVPTMIPIFKPRPIVRKDFTNSFNPARLMANPTPTPITSQADLGHLNPMYNAQKFTIPCQRAADVLDMSNVALPREIPKDHVQPNLQPISLIPSSDLSNQTQNTVSVHCADSDDSVAVLFKPKAISLNQLYGNLLKKITITVLVPYHMSKMGQQ